MRAIVVIPARHQSTRFPGKPLALLCGRPMIAWVVDAALRAERIDEVWVATDEEEIARAAREAGAKTVMTSPDCASGTDRVAEAVASVECDAVINLQGDEPAIDPSDVDKLVGVFDAENPPEMATLARPLTNPDELASPDVVKVVCGKGGDALYFSRSPIPFDRDGWGSGPAASSISDDGPPPLKHLGVYGFTREAVLDFPKLEEGSLERIEKLEQLRALEAGWKIKVIEARTDSIGVDTPADVAAAEQALADRGLA